MRRRPLLTGMLALALGSAAPAFGQPRGDRNDPRDRSGRNDRDRPPGQRGGPPGQRGGPPGGRDWDARGRDPRRDPGRGDRNRDQAPHSRGAGPDRSFYPGGRLPPSYRHRNYVVDDWRGHRLPPPPRGYYWVQTGADYVLVAIATGIILQILLSN
jgi:Ni/Co efflux regulator RcnB